ncbi:MAG: heparinase II/III family protein [Ferruginibacter sp.]
MNVLFAQNHPNLILTKKGVDAIKASLGKAPLFDKALSETIKEVDKEIKNGIEVPVPKDMAGGYTHERHKKNWTILQKAGVLFQVTGKEKYAVYIRDMLLAYAKLYPTLGLHSANKSYATGKLFWQCLNDANWLVYVSQAYDCVYDWLNKKDRDNLERNLFKPYADFLSVGNPQFFNRIHNHSTWGCAAVGMIGLVMHDDELVQRALYGLPIDNTKANERDNDGALIRPDGQVKAGFLAQLDESFSPNGYFTEGPYYLRYAIFPFLQFSKALANSRPELNIPGYRDTILKKAVYALLNQTDFQGRFFPINDAQKGMSWNSKEAVNAVDLTYHQYGKDEMLLSIAAKQHEVILDEAGFSVARDLALGLAKPFKHTAMNYNDGSKGTQGGVGILRTGINPDNELCVVMKYSAQGMGHGHFDKLSYSLYDEEGEVLQDYGAVRWVNIDQKGGGRYLPENETWAKQTIAHNTLVINEKSNYNGDIKIAEKYYPELYYFNGNGNVQIISAKTNNAYPGSELHRTMILMKDKNFREPVVIDIFKVNSETNNQYDLPIWFEGHLMQTDFEYKKETINLTTLGIGNGYQHLWKEAVGNSKSNNAKITWFGNGKFYSSTCVVNKNDELIFARLGANDPNFNLRLDPAFIIRKKNSKEATFVSIVEPHGEYNPVAEIAQAPFTSIENLSIVYDDKYFTIIKFSNKAGKNWEIMIANTDNSKDGKHKVKAGDKVFEWNGVLSVIQVK